MPSKKLKVIVTRRLPDAVETRLRELFDAELNVDDTPFTADQLADAVQRADVLVPTVTDRIDGRILSRAGDQLRLIAQFSTDGNLLRLPNLLLQKFPAECFTADTVIELDAEDGTEAGLAIIGKTSAAIALRAMPGGTQFVFRVNDTDTILSANSPSRAKISVQTARGGCGAKISDSQDRAGDGETVGAALICPYLPPARSLAGLDST